MNKEPFVKKRLAQYRIESKIGAGGMGEVYKAKDTRLERDVALKILPAEFAEDTDRMSRFEREAKSISALNHPNIITIHEIGEFEGTHFIATEFIDGQTLGEYAKANTLSHISALEIAIQIASALHAAHSEGIVHRDIKPDNVMVRKDSLVKVLDFGIAKLSAPKDKTGEEAAKAIQAQTQAGMVIGTPNYMSPEQARGQGVDHQTDIFSFGVVLYELLSGASPFAGDTVGDVIAAVLMKEPEPLAHVPPELRAIVQKCLQKDKQKRYRTAKYVLDDLKEAKEELAISNRLKRVSSSNAAEPQTKIMPAAPTGEEDRRVTLENLKSIAVLPFTNMSADEENEYFCDGLAEELLNALSKIEDLKVAARTSAFSFKGKNANVSKIGEKLNVENVLEGSVRRSGDKLRISVQLVSAANGFQLWSERYDREMKDIFDVQDEIALAVVDALKLKLFADEKAAVLKRYTDNTEAYQLYLKGRFYAGKLTPEGYRKSVECYEQALSIEPNYALALAALSITYVVAWYLGFDETARSISQAKATVNKALVLDHALAEAQFALGLIKFNYERDWTEAEKAFKRAIELNPSFAESYEHYSMFLAVMERSEEAAAVGQRAIELAPLALKTIYIAAWGFWLAGQNNLAKEQGKKLLEMEPNFSGGYIHLGINLWDKRAYQQSLEALETAVKLGSGNDIRMLLGLLYGMVGERGKAKQLLSEFERLDAQRIFTACHQAFVHAGLSEMDRAFALLEQASERREGVLVFLKQFSSLCPKFHNDSRMAALLERIGLPTDTTDQTGESLEASTMMLSGSRATSETSSKELDTEQAGTNPPTDSKAEVRKPKSKWWLFGLLGLLALVGGLFGYKYFAPANKQIESIAVMPFVNEGGNADTEYLSDGMTETLINSLSQLPNLSVKARSSVFRYKGKDIDPKQIASELNVQAILNGRIVQRGEQLTLNLELIDAKTDNVLWSDSYNRKQSDLVTLQSDIAHDVSTKLKSKLSGADAAKVERTYTTNPEAYQLYLKGNFHRTKYTEEGYKRAIDYYKQAIALDPNYALAYTGISFAYITSSEWYLPGNEAMPKAKAAALKALELDNTLPEPYINLGDIAFFYDYEWADSERMLKRAIELDPNSKEAHHAYAFLLAGMSRFDEAIKERKFALSFDPFELQFNSFLAQIYLFAGQYDEAIEQSRKTIEIDQNNWSAYEFLGQAYERRKQFPEAIAALEKARRSDNNPEIAGYLGYVYAAAGKKVEAQKIMDKLKELSKQRYVSPYYIAIIYAGLNDKDQAFEWLNKAFDAHSSPMAQLKVDTVLDNLHDDPRFKDLLQRMNLPE